MKIWYFLKNEGKFTTYIYKMEYFHKYYPFLEEVFIRKDWHKMAKIVINIFFLQFFTRIHVEYLKIHNLDARNQYQCF